MQKKITIAAVLLAVQVGLVMLFQLVGSGRSSSAPDTSWLSVKAEQVSVVEITGSKNDKMVLEKSGDAWLIKDSFGALASNEQVKAMLEKIAGFKKGFAVATTPGAAKRFKVAEDQFERHIVLKDKDTIVGDFYVGTSPGFRQIHARKSGSDEVLVVALSTFELETARDTWLDKNLLHEKKDELTGLVFPEVTLKKIEDKWQAEGLAAGQETEAKEIEKVVDRAANVTIQDVLDPAVVAPLLSTTPAFKFSLTRKDGKSVEFAFYKQEGDAYVLKQSDRDLVCKVTALQVEGLKKVTKESILKETDDDKSSGDKRDLPPALSGGNDLTGKNEIVQ